MKFSKYMYKKKINKWLPRNMIQGIFFFGR